MSVDISSLINNKNYNDLQKKYFEDFNIVETTYKKTEDLVAIKINSKYILPLSLLNDLKEYFKSLGVEKARYYFKTSDNSMSIEHFNEYLHEYANKNNAFKDGIAYDNDNCIEINYLDEHAMNEDERQLDDLKLYFYDLGFRKEIELKLKPKKEIVIEKREPLPESEKVEYKPQGDKSYYKRRPKKDEYVEVTIDDLTDVINGVKFKSKIFKVEEITTRTGLVIQTLYLKDRTNALIAKIIENKHFTKELLKENKIDRSGFFYGNYIFDSYTKDFVFMINHIEFIEEDSKKLVDDAIEKRVELHAHTKLSEMDGICSPTELVNSAFEMGHKAIAITDHLCLQGFHEAQTAYKGIKKANPDSDFKVLYGCEMNMVAQNLNIVYNPSDEKINDAEYVVFDLETTGLSARHDYIIEFGAVLMYKGMEIERKDFFVKPPIQIPTLIKEKTNIMDRDVENARTFAECKDEILDFINGRVLVAHNASFDFGFLNEELNRIGEPKLTNTVIDTLDLSRSLFKTRRAYRLGNMARQYNVEYDEKSAHRADYDAEVLANVFNLMMKDCTKENVLTFNDLEAFQGKDAFVKNRAYHVTMLAKNLKGVHDLYKLVSISNTETLAVFGKANAKSDDSECEFIAEPRIFKETINQYRNDLLIGSACFNGEVFEYASTKSKEELAKVISFYDYIEIQPLENYRFLYEDREQFTKERLKQYLKDIIEEAKAQNKIIVATGDTHYVFDEEKLARDIFINTKAIGGARHPLYLFDEEKRKKQISPNQKLLNTSEMLKAFEWLGDDKFVKEIVIDNTNKISSMCEEIKPFNDKLCPPKVLDAIKKAKECNIYEEPFINTDEVISADEYLKRLVYYNAHEKYGDELESVIEERIEKELKAIIGNGYGVIYYTCHLLCKRSNNDGYVVGSRGSVGSSLVATLSGITEVNPLAPHYVCPKCHHLEWVKDAASGYDLPDKKCPNCKTKMNGDGQNIPFETFMGFNGDKIPDIDLNFSGDYQGKAHLFTREIFGENNVFRAGTISTVADKTAFGYINKYCLKEKEISMSRAQKEWLAQICVDVKRTTGQHAGGIVVLPDDMNIEDVTPIQYPANDPNATWRSTHFEYHDYSDNLLKFDILGHVDPTAMKFFTDTSGIDIKTIPMNDPKVLSLFNSSEALNIINPNYHEETGACGLPEFGTLNTRRTIQETRPKVFSELVQISGLSHGTDVWNGNAQDLIRSGIKLKDVIGCRDDIMSRLMHYGLEAKDAFQIMEFVRKNKTGKALPEDMEKSMLEHNVPKWYIDSCKKIKYMFPKAHAVAYCIMAVRVAWFKVYHPEYYYAHYFSLRSNQYELSTMIKDADSIYARMKELQAKMNSKEDPITKKEEDIFDTLEVAYEMVSRGYRMTSIDLEKSLATEFRINPDNPKEIIPPFKVIEGLGDNVAVSIINARNERPFMSKEDLSNRTGLSGTLLKKLDELGALKGLDETDQVSLF